MKCNEQSKKGFVVFYPCVSRGREQLNEEVTVHALRGGNQCMLQIKPAVPRITVLCFCYPSMFQVILSLAKA